MPTRATPDVYKRQVSVFVIAGVVGGGTLDLFVQFLFQLLVVLFLSLIHIWRIQEAEAAEVNEMVRTAKVTPEQLAALLRQSATSTPTPAALSAVCLLYTSPAARVRA